MTTAPVEAAAAELARYLDEAEALIAEHDSPVPAMIGSGQHAAESGPPWNAAVADAITGAWAAVRHLEHGLRLRVTGTALYRGGSRGNTLAALDAITRLTLAAGQHDTPPPDRKPCPCDQCRVRRSLNRLVIAFLALAAIDKAIRWMPVYQRTADDTVRPVTCPYCKTPSLRAAFEHYLVGCGNEDCQDANGNQPVARIEMSRGEWVLAWDDGLVT